LWPECAVEDISINFVRETMESMPRQVYDVGGVN
jgi:hypothetical protein